MPRRALSAAGVLVMVGALAVALSPGGQAATAPVPRAETGVSVLSQPVQHIDVDGARLG